MARSTEGTSCGQWPPRPPGTGMATSALPLATDLPALRAGQTEILLAPPRLPSDPAYTPLAPPLSEPAKGGRGDPKRTAPRAVAEMVSHRSHGWLPPAIRAALVDLGHHPGPGAVAEPTASREGGACAALDPPSGARDVPSPAAAADTETQGSERNVLWDDLRAMLAEPSERKRATQNSVRHMAVPSLGSSAGQAQGVATRSRAAAEAPTVPDAPHAVDGTAAAPGVDGADEVPNGQCDACRTPGSLLCCDECERAFHFTCLDPPWDLDQLPQGLVHDAPWSCNACRARTRPPRKGKGKGRLLQPLLTTLERENPREFALPSEVQGYFLGVAADPGGAYLEADMLLPWRPVTIKAAKMMLAPQRDPYRLRNGGELVLCFACGTSALPPAQDQQDQMDQVDTTRRPLLSCDFCPLHWHLDCLEPPLVPPPSQLRKWRCPAHTAHDLQPVRHARTAELAHGHPDRPAREAAAHRAKSGGDEGRDKVPEHVVQRTFWDRTSRGIERLQAYAAHHALTAQNTSGSVTLTRAGQKYDLSVPRGLSAGPGQPVQAPHGLEPTPTGALAADLRLIMDPVPYPLPLDTSLTFIAHPVPCPWPESGGGVLVVPPVQTVPAGRPGQANGPGTAAGDENKLPAPRQLPSRRSKTTGEAQRRDTVRKRKRGRRTDGGGEEAVRAGKKQAMTLHGPEAESSLWRSTAVVSQTTVAQLAAVQRVVDYVGEEAVRRFVDAK